MKAIESFSDLGSGFNIAMQDLDIRGAGNLLGAEQSGFITDMGFETYQKILSEAMEELGMETGMMTRNVSENYVSDCTIDTDQLALIPDTYMDVTAAQIRIYKELDSISSDKSLRHQLSQLQRILLGTISQSFLLTSHHQIALQSIYASMLKCLRQTIESR